MLHRRSKAIILLLTLVVLALSVSAAFAQGNASTPVSNGGVTPYIIAGENPGGNRTCAEVGLAFFGDPNYFQFSSARVNYNSGAFDQAFPAGLTVNTDGTYVSFTSDFAIGAVIVKGSSDANVYVYNPQVKSDSGLASPPNDSGSPAGLSNITFCWNPEPTPHVTVSKTANTSWTRAWTWTIDKSATEMELWKNYGDSVDIYYLVKVTANIASVTYAVEGIITVLNDGTVPAEVTGVSDDISGFGAPNLLCPAFPQTLQPGQSLNCTYNATLPNGDARTNSASATLTEGDVTLGTAPITFSATPTSETDECVDVSDTLGGTLGTNVCATYDGQEFSFSYSHHIASVGCGDTYINNTATFTTKDTGATGSDNWTVVIRVNCEWCSPGYWRQEQHLDSWAATGYSTNDKFEDKIGYYPTLSRQGVRNNAPTDPTLLEVLQHPEWYGGDAFNAVGDLLSEAHPDVNFVGVRVENCPLN